MPDVNALEAQISESGDFGDAEWTPYIPSVRFTITDGDRIQPVYARFRHEFFQSDPVSAQIMLDTHADINEFNWSSDRGANTHFMDDEVSFQLTLNNDVIGLETGGTAVVSIENIGDVLQLNDSDDGSYAGTYYIQEGDFVDDGALSVRFVDRAGNTAEAAAGQTITIHAKPHNWEVIQTNTYHTIMVEEAFIDNAALANRDQIGVFTSAGLCAGVVVATGFPIRVFAYGDLPTTRSVEGFVEGERMSFKIWDADQNLEMEAFPYNITDGGLDFQTGGRTTLSLRADP